MPEVTYASLHKEAIFVVELTKPDAVVQWTVNNKPITDSIKYTTLTDNKIRKLIVRNVRDDDQWVYKCTVADLVTSSKLELEGNCYNI